MTVCLVTGGAGFIGSHIVDALVARGFVVRVLDNFSTGTLANLAAIRHKVELIFGDIANLEVVREASKGVDLVFHEATPDLGYTLWDPQEKSYSRETGTLHVLIAAHEAKVKRVIYASSARVYGPSPIPLSEEDPAQPTTSYGIAKLTGEQQCVVFTSNYGLETVRLRYFNVFGPRQPTVSPYGSMVPSILRAMLLGRNPVIHGDGRQPQDFIYVDDVVHANLLAAEAGRVSGRVYNIGRGRTGTPLEVVDALNSILNTHLHPFHTHLGPEDELQNRVADMSRSESELGFCPSTSLEQGLTRWIESLASWRDDFRGLEKAAKPEVLEKRPGESGECPPGA
jgi:UDP-glucose 4-epimerase